MSSQISQLRPRSTSFEAAVAAYRDGRPNGCLDAIREHDGFEVSLLRARASLRAGCPELGLEKLCSIDDALLPSNRARAELLILRGALQTRVREFDQARITFDAARVYAFGAASSALEAEYHFYEAVWCFSTGDGNRANLAAEQVLNIEPLLYDVAGYFVPIRFSRARALQLRGLLAAARERYGEQAQYVRSAIAEVQGTDQPDLWIFATFLMDLAFHVRDFDLIEDAAMLREELENAKKWPDELAPMQFEIRRALGWSSALRGDHVNAFREFRTMSQFATTPARKVLASVDRAYLARELGEKHSAHEEVEHASKLADRIDWNKVGEERIGLAQLAQEMASYDPSRAKYLFDEYRELKERLAPNMLNNVDRRVRAYEFLAEATVLRANGSIPAAIQRFIKAFEIWDELGYHWRAATAALPVAQIIKQQKFIDYVRREAASRPGSWLARHAEKLVDQEEPAYERDLRLANAPAARVTTERDGTRGHLTLVHS